jgi:hypothetical protein
MVENEILTNAQEAPAVELPVFLDIVIPYVFSTPVWDELKFALRSIHKNARFEHRVFIVADKLPPWADPQTLNLIKVKQIEGVPFAKAFDQYRKLDAVCNDVRVSENFVYAYDDQLWSNPVNAEQMQQLWAGPQVRNTPELDQQVPNGGANWKSNFINTINLLLSLKKPCFNYETHMPRVFNKLLMKQLIELHNLTNHSQTLVSTLYFNSMQDQEPSMFDGLNIKGKVRAVLSRQQINSILSKNRFIDYNNEGLTALFQEIIQKKFPNPSPYEI